MSVVCLRDDILTGNPDPGGAWIITSAPSFPVTIDGVVYNLNDPVDPGNDNPCIDFAGVPAGDYNFEYFIDLPGVGCDDTAIGTVTASPFPDLGVNTETYVCGCTPPFAGVDAVAEVCGCVVPTPFPDAQDDLCQFP